MLKTNNADLEVRVAESPRRLIAIVPCDLVDLADFASKIHSLAVQSERKVLYVSLGDREEDFLSSSRSLATLEALTRDPGTNVTTSFIQGSNWVHELRKIVCPDDILISPVYQTARMDNFQSGLLNERLEEKLHIPVRVITVSDHPQPISKRSWFRSLVLTLCLLAVLAGLTLLEIRVDEYIFGMTRKFLLILLLSVQFGFIFVWNKLMS